jgi:hypothetical protein
MNMRNGILVAGSMMAAMAGSLAAAEQQLLNLVMPDVKVISDINVAQTNLTPFGQYALSQLANSGVEQLTALTGFDPSKDLNELLCASNGTQNTGLALATGTFNLAKIATLAAQNGEATETYQGFTIFENPAKTDGVAFLSATVLVAGDVADVKAAINRTSAPSTLPTSLTNQISMFSSQVDAWVISTVSPSLLPHGTATNKPGDVGGVTIPANVLSQITSGYATVIFGSNVMLAAQAQTTDAPTATNLASMLQLLQNLALMQAQQNANLLALAKAVTITASGAAVNVTASLSEDQFQALVQAKPRTARKIVR